MARPRRDIILLTHLRDSGFFSDGQYKASNDFLAAQGWTEWQVKKLVEELRDDGLIDGQFAFLGFLRELDPGGKYYPYEAGGRIIFIAITPKGERYLDSIKEKDVHLRLAGKNLVVFWVIFTCVVLGTVFSLWQALLSARQARSWPYSQQEPPKADASTTTAPPLGGDTFHLDTMGAAHEVIAVECGPCPSDSAKDSHSLSATDI